tara:strand:+ start:9948 stop:10391 length:444 start_codon:yes stop_codon:yes gene_type:complete
MGTFSTATKETSDMKKPEGYNERESAKRIERFDLEKRIEKLIQASVDCQMGATLESAGKTLMGLFDEHSETRKIIPKVVELMQAKEKEKQAKEKRIEKLIQALIDCTGKTIMQARDELMVLDLGDENLSMVVHAAMRMERMKGETAQ